jgi:hypothetical protein
MDHVLLPLIMSHPGECGAILDELRGLSTWRAFPSARVYETILAAHEQGESLAFASIHDRLSEADQTWLASLLLHSVHTPQIEDGLSCLAALQLDEQESALRDLRARIKSAEREGRIQDALTLMQQLRLLEQKKQRRPQ